ncbi:hypothetical protein FJZ17_02780 [Candidatus Pacearchaeota archaeon]|nr:hypothetical protein [Candidatus Pacearchaeota archaeon]
MIIELIFSLALLLIGMFCFFKPNNFLLQFLEVGDGTNAVKRYGKENAIFIMKITGFVLIIVGLFFLSSFI